MRHQSKQIKIPPQKVSAVDATGAGDAFDGAFLAEYIRHQDVFKSALYANASAALSTEGYGAVSPLPNREKVELFLKRRFNRLIFTVGIPSF